jgi:hypothetical protein
MATDGRGAIYAVVVSTVNGKRQHPDIVCRGSDIHCALPVMEGGREILDVVPMATLHQDVTAIE